MNKIFKSLFLLAALAQPMLAVADQKTPAFNEPQYSSFSEAMKDAGNLATCNFFGGLGCAEWLYTSVDDNLYKSIYKMSNEEIEQETLIAGKVKEAIALSSNSFVYLMTTIFSVILASVGALMYIYDRMYKKNSIRKVYLPATTLCLGFALIVYVDLSFAVKSERITFTQQYALRSMGYGYKILNSIYRTSNLEDKIYLEPFTTPDFKYKSLDMIQFRDFVMCLKAQQNTTVNFRLNADNDFIMRETQVKSGCGAVITIGQNKEIGRLVEEFNLSAKGIDSAIDNANRTALTKLFSYANKELDSIISDFESEDDSQRNKAYINYYNLPDKLSEVYIREIANMVPNQNLAGRQKLMCDSFESNSSLPYFRVKELLGNGSVISGIADCVGANKSKSITEYLAAAYLERQLYAVPFYHEKGVFFAATGLLENHTKPSENYKTIARNFSFKFFLTDSNTYNASSTVANNVFTFSAPISVNPYFDSEKYEELLRNYVNETEKTISTDKTQKPWYEMIKSDSAGIFGFTKYKECMNFYNFNTISPSGFVCGDFYSNNETLGTNITKFSVQAAMALGSSKLTQYGVKRFKLKGAAQNALVNVTAKTAAAIGVNELADLMSDEISGDPFSDVDADVYYKSEIASLMGAQAFLKAEVFDPFISSIQRITFWFGASLFLLKYTIMFSFAAALLLMLAYGFTTTIMSNGLAYNYLRSSSSYNNVGVEKIAAFYVRWIAYFAALSIGWYFIKEVIPVVISFKLDPNDLLKIKNVPEGINDLYSVIDNIFSSCVYVFLLHRLSLRAIFDAFKSPERIDYLATGKSYENLNEHKETLLGTKLNKHN